MILRLEMRTNRIAYGIIVFLALIFIIFMGSRFSYTVLYIVLLLPLASILLALLASKRLRYKQKIKTNAVFKGDNLDIEIIMSNDDIIIYPYISFVLYDIFEEKTALKVDKDNKERRYTYSIPARSTYSVHVNVPCNYRGFFPVGVKTAEVIDFFGLVKFKRDIDYDLHVTVYPRFKKLQNLYLSKGSEEESMDSEGSLMENSSDISDIRKYQYADSMKKIHWKLSSKKNDWLVKNYSDSVEYNTEILIDLSPKKIYEKKETILVEDTIIETSLSLLDYCVSSSITCIVSFDNKGIQEIKCATEQDFNTIYSILARTSFNGKNPMDKLAARSLAKGAKNTNLLIVTDSISEKIVGQLIQATLLSYNVTLYLICVYKSEVADSQTNETLAKLKNSGIRVTIISCNN